jgi:hypothetical protein
MPAIFFVNQTQSFRGVMFLSSTAKTVFGDNQKQDTTSDGIPKWEVQVVATFDQFGRAENEILKIGVASYKDPAEALGGMPQPVELVNFRIGVTPVEKRNDKNGVERITGGKVWYQADEVRSTAQAPAPRAAKSES